MRSSSLLGLVLCGGESSRMGTDKGVLMYAGQTWAQRGVENLRTLSVPVYVSIFPTQQDTYATLFPASQLLVDALPFRGPLAALLTAHAFAPDADWLVLACDLPDMQPDVLQHLQQVYTHQTRYGCYVYAKDGQPEPLCGIYTTQALRKIYPLAVQGQLPRHSMKYLLQQINTCTLPLTPTQAAAFRNCNTPDDCP